MKKLALIVAVFIITIASAAVSRANIVLDETTGIITSHDHNGIKALRSTIEGRMPYFMQYFETNEAYCYWYAIQDYGGGLSCVKKDASEELKSERK